MIWMTHLILRTILKDRLLKSVFYFFIFHLFLTRYQRFIAKSSRATKGILWKVSLPLPFRTWLSSLEGNSLPCAFFQRHLLHKSRYTNTYMCVSTVYFSTQIVAYHTCSATPFPPSTLSWRFSLSVCVELTHFNFCTPFY